MKFTDLIERINDAYPDDMLALYAREPEGDHGDPLAKFIVAELRETFEPEQGDEYQARMALDLIDKAHREVGAVVERLHAVWESTWQGGVPSA